MSLERNCKHWLPDECAEMELRWTSGETAKMIGRALGRTDRAVHARVAKVGLSVADKVPHWHSRIERRLAWSHGSQRAARIGAGLDASTEADVAAWDHLGSSRERAA